MRVIAGERKGFRLESVKGQDTRPTSDKVKEALFHGIGPFFDGGWVLDLYGGTGNLGIEALSRGMEHAIFVDQSKNAIRVIQNNLAHTGYTDRSEVYLNHADRALRALAKRGASFQLILLDPPYARAGQALPSHIQFIDEFSLLDRGGTIVAEHAQSLKLPQHIGGLTITKTMIFGDTAVTIFQYDKG